MSYQNSFQSSQRMAQTALLDTRGKSLESSESSIDAARKDYEQKRLGIYDAVVAES